MSFKDKKFGLLTIRKTLIKDTLYLCDCKCGNLLKVAYSLLANGVQLDCGMCRLKFKVTRNGSGSRGGKLPFGHRRIYYSRSTRGGKRIRRMKASGELNSWNAMKERCLQPRCEVYKDYGGRGITICQRWLVSKPKGQGFKNFVHDMGPRPKGKTLDRRNPQGHYEPTNCQWATKKEQSHNRRFVLFRKGKEPSVASIRAMEKRVRELQAEGGEVIY